MFTMFTVVAKFHATRSRLKSHKSRTQYVRGFARTRARGLHYTDDLKERGGPGMNGRL